MGKSNRIETIEAQLVQAWVHTIIEQVPGRPFTVRYPVTRVDESIRGHGLRARRWILLHCGNNLVFIRDPNQLVTVELVDGYDKPPKAA